MILEKCPEIVPDMIKFELASIDASADEAGY